MAPRLLTPLETPPPIPPVSPERWWPQAPWHHRIDSLPVDEARTAELGRFNARIRNDGGVPLQAASLRNTTVLRAKPSWKLVKLPLPERVVVTDNGDAQGFFVDEAAGRYWEVSSLGPIWFGSWWRADSVRQFNLRTAWDSQPRAMTGAGIPLWPMIPTPQRLATGSITTALHLVMAGYSVAKPVGMARKTDGNLNDHPCRAGERLRLTPEALNRLTAERLTLPQSAVVWGLARYGCVVTDKTSPTAGHNLRLPAGVDLDLPLTLTDLEVVAQ